MLRLERKNTLTATSKALSEKQSGAGSSVLRLECRGRALRGPGLLQPARWPGAGPRGRRHSAARGGRGVLLRGPCRARVQALRDPGQRGERDGVKTVTIQ